MNVRTHIRTNLLSLVIAFPLLAQTPDDAFRRGNDLYRAGQFQQSATEYQTILKQGLMSGEVYFNLGNACYRMGKLAPAILAYERAVLFTPNDPDVRHNLRLVYLKTTDRIEPVPELFLLQWLRSASSLFSGGTTASLFVDAWAVLFLSLALIYALAKPVVVRLARVAVFVSAVAVLLFSALLGLQYSQLSAHDTAIVVSPVVTAKSSPDEQSVDAFVIHEGLKIRLSDAVGDWVKITLADGKVGWVKSQDCERI